MEAISINKIDALSSARGDVFCKVIYFKRLRSNSVAKPRLILKRDDAPQHHFGDSCQK